MYSVKAVIFGMLFPYISYINVNGASVNSSNTEGSKSSNSSSGNGTDFDDRLNLNFNRAGAFGMGNNGGFSLSDSNSYGVNAGIRGPGGYTQNLFNQAQSHSNGFSSGPGAPLTFANSGTRNRPGGFGGNANAGVLGGPGQSYAQSINQNIEVPLGDGTVFFSNLKERNNGTEPSASNATTGQKDKNRDSLILS